MEMPQTNTFKVFKKSKLLLFSPLFVLLLISSCSSFNRDRYKTKSTQERRAELFYTQGTRKLLDREYTEALTNLLEAFKLKPNDSKIRNNLGMAYFFKDRPQIAIEHLLKAIELDPQNSDARINLGSIYHRKGELDLALRQYEEALEDLTYRHHYRTHYNIALIYEQNGQFQQTMRKLDQSLGRNSEFCPALFKKGSIFYQNRRYAQAKDLFHQASRGGCSEDPAALYFRAMSMFQLGENRDALKAFEDIAMLHPTSEFANLSRQQAQSLRSKVRLTDQDQNSNRYNSSHERQMDFRNPSLANPSSLDSSVLDLRHQQGQAQQLNAREYEIDTRDRETLPVIKSPSF